jgi:hypothetical protein
LNLMKRGEKEKKPCKFLNDSDDILTNYIIKFKLPYNFS